MWGLRKMTDFRSQMTVAGRNQHHPIYKLVYSSLLAFMPHQACQIKDQSLCNRTFAKVEGVPPSDKCWAENQQLCSQPFPTATTPLAAVGSLPTYKICLKEDDKTKVAKSPPEGSPDFWVQGNWGEDMAGCFYSVVIPSFVPYQKTIHYAHERNSYDFHCSKPEVLSLLVFSHQSKGTTKKVTL